MKITRVEVWTVSMRLKEPYTLAYETVEETTNVFVRMETDRRIVGYGCAAPAEEVTGETPDRVLTAVRDVAEPCIRGADPLRLNLVLSRLASPLRRQPAAVALVDMALHDILGKACGMPLWRLLGGFRDRIKTSVTIGILPEEETVDHAREWLARGFTCLKLKGGLDVESDIARVLKVREAVGDGIALRFDANQGFTLEQTVRFAEGSRRARLEVIEQPTPRDRLDLLGEATKRVPVPIMADESVTSLRDALAIARGGLANMLNIKLMKVGGISEALRIDAVAASAGMPVMVGCMDEAALAILAGVHVALASPNVAYADLDGHLDLLGDPSDGAVVLRNGTLHAPTGPGLGFNLEDEQRNT